MIRFRNILTELAKRHEPSWEEFANGYKIEHGDDAYVEAIELIEEGVRKWVGTPTNDGGNNLESIFDNNLPEFKQYQQDTLRKEFGNTATLVRGLSFYAGGIVHEAMRVTDPDQQMTYQELFKSVTEKSYRWAFANDNPDWKDIVLQNNINLTSSVIRYSSWSFDDDILKMYSNGHIVHPTNFGVTLTADVPIDKIMFSGEAFPRTLDSITDMEYVVKHDKPFECIVDIVNVGVSVRPLFDVLGVKYDD